MKDGHPFRRHSAWLPLLFALAGCGGGSTGDTGDYYLTLDLDGQPRTFNVQISANDPPSEAKVNFVTVRGQASDATFPQFGFQLVSAGIEPGTFQSAHYELYANYVLEGTTFQSTDRDGSHFTMTLTRLDDDGVAGTFSGALRERGAGEAAPLLHVTNGRFSAQYNYR